jgi:hypothetical protein
MRTERCRTLWALRLILHQSARDATSKRMGGCCLARAMRAGDSRAAGALYPLPSYSRSGRRGSGSSTLRLRGRFSFVFWRRSWLHLELRSCWWVCAPINRAPPGALFAAVVQKIMKDAGYARWSCHPGPCGAQGSWRHPGDKHRADKGGSHDRGPVTACAARIDGKMPRSSEAQATR